MAVTATATLNINLQAALSQALTAFSSQSASATLPVTITQALIAASSGVAGVNCIYSGQVTLAASGTSDLDMHLPGNDPFGNALSIVAVRILIIQNLAALETDTMSIGGKGATSGWTSLLTPNTAIQVIKGAGGVYIAVAPGAVGYAVGASTTNHLLTFLNNSGANSVTCNVIILGTTA